MRWLGLLLLVAGCAGRPVAVAPRGEIVWTAAAGGAWVGGCRLDDGLAVVGPGEVERWTLPADGPPQRVAQHRFDWPVGPRAVAVECEGDAAVVRFADGRAARSDAEWRVIDAASAVGGGGWTTVEFARGERALVFDRGGWSLRVGGAVVDRRSVAGDLADATWDGADLWAVGPGGLWRWRPGMPHWARVPLPPPARGRALTRIWQDGPFLWVVDEALTGYALDVRSGAATLARPPGPIRMTGADQATLLDGHRVEVTLGGDAWTVVDPDGTARAVPLGGRVHAFGTLGDDEVLIGVDDAIERWRVRGPERVARWPVGAVTRRVIATGDRVFAVGGYGLLVGRVERVSPPRAADRGDPPSPAPAPSSAAP